MFKLSMAAGKETSKGHVLRRTIGAIVILQPISTTRKRILALLAVVLFVALIFMLNVLYNFATNFISVRHRINRVEGEQRDAIWPTGYYPPNTYGFHPVNDRGVYSFWNVCIEAVSQPITQEIDMFGGKLYFNETAKIIVYNSFYRDGIQRLQVTGSHNSAWNFWDVDFRRGRIPETHEFRKTSVFFVSQTCPANLHHFWIDEFVPLYCTIERSNRLHRDADNTILYRRPTQLAGSDVTQCYNKSRYEEILKTVYINPFHDVFYEAPRNVCFSSGVFGTHPFVDNPRKIVEHVVSNVTNGNGRSSAENVQSSPYFVTFIQRRTRRIINIRDLLKAALLVGYRRVRIIDFERYSLPEQMRYATSSCVMIGIQGAGLQWAVFMPAGCTLIEIAWPQQHWGFHFINYVQPYGIRHFSVRAVNVKVNWAAYELNVRKGKRVPVTERVQLLKAPPRSPSVDNIWKYADAFVNEDNLMEIMTSIEPNPRLPATDKSTSRSQ